MPATILHAESFGWGGAALSIGGAFSGASDIGIGRGGRGSGANQGYSLGTSDLFSGGYASLDFGALGLGPRTTVGMAVAFGRYHNSRSGTISGPPLGIFHFGESGFTHVSFIMVADGYIEARRDDGTVYGTSSLPLTSVPNAYTHLEAVVTVHLSAGMIELYMDEMPVISLHGLGVFTTHLDASPPPTGHVTSIVLGAGANVGSVGEQFTDLVLHDGGGTVGDVRVTYHPAAVAGTYVAGAAIGGATLLDCVKEQDVDLDTSYIKFDDQALPKAASFGVTALPDNVISVKAVIPQVVVRKDDAGGNQGRILIKSGATEADNGADLVVPTAYTVLRSVFPTNPNTSAPWTVTEANGVEVGFRRTV